MLITPFVGILILVVLVAQVDASSRKRRPPPNVKRPNPSRWKE